MRRIGLFSVIALALVGVLAVGVGVALNRGDDTRVEQANTPTVSNPPAPETTSEKTEKEETEGEKTEKEETEEQQAAEEQAAQEAAEQQAAEEQAAQEAAEQAAAEQRAAEQAAAEQRAAEQAAAEQRAAEQAAAEQAAEQRAAEQAAQEERWRELAEQREAEERAAAERRAAEREASEEAAQQQTPAPPASAALSLTVPSAGIQGDPVTNSVAESVLANGAGKIPSTGFPWQSGSNTYIAGHVYGYPGTGSWQQFARVPNMSMGDQILLTDSNGTTYEYQVSEILTVAPTDVWVTQSTGQTSVSLQTCVGPNWGKRLIVRGTLVGTSQA